MSGRCCPDNESELRRTGPAPSRGAESPDAGDEITPVSTVNVVGRRSRPQSETAHGALRSGPVRRRSRKQPSRRNAFAPARSGVLTLAGRVTRGYAEPAMARRVGEL